MDKFVEDYVAHALICNTTEDGDELLSDNYDIDDIDEDTMLEISNDCREFREGLSPELRALVDKRPEVAGSHFYMARNGMAEGFNDDDWPPPAGAQLRKAASAYEPMELFLDEDRRIRGW